MIMDEPIKFLLIVKVRLGLNILDTPRPQSQGAYVRRSVPVGTGLYAYGIHNIDGVDYARLVAQNPLKPEWVRVAEADHSIEYVDVIDMKPENDAGQLATALTLLATALRELTRK
jgi:hypothetical protein